MIDFLQGTRGLWEFPRGYLVWGFGTVYWKCSRFLNLVCVSFTCCILYSDAHTKTALLCHIQHSNMLIYSFKAILLNFLICCWAFVNVFSVIQVISTAFLTKHEFCTCSFMNGTGYKKCEQLLIMNYGLHARV